MAAGTIFALSSTAMAAGADEEVQAPPEVKKIQLPLPQKNFDEPEYLVNGVIKDITQKILPVSVEARFYAPHMDLDLKLGSVRYDGGSVNLKDHLGFGNDNAPEAIFRYKRMTLDYINVHGDGDSTFGAGSPLTFGGRNFYGNTHSKSDLQYIKLNFTNPIVSVLGSGVDWSYGLTGVYWEGKVHGTDLATGTSISRSKKAGAPIPTLGVGAHASILDTLLLHAHISGMPLGGYGHYYDLEAGLRYNPLDLLSISVGYRRINIKLEHRNDSGEATLNGPYAGLRFDF